MSSDPKLDVALKILKLAGHKIGDAHIPPPQDGYAMVIWIDGVFLALLRVYGCIRRESTSTTDWHEAQKKLRERLQARDGNFLDIVRKG